MKLPGKYGNIRAMRASLALAISDWLITFPVLYAWSKKTASSLRLDYTANQRKQIEKDIRHGACFITNHRDIIMDAAWLSMLLRTRYLIRPYMGIGNNLFGHWWLEGLMRFLRCFVVIRNGSTRDQLKNSQELGAYIRHIRERHRSIWIAQREGRAKDGNDVTQPAVLKMMTLGADDFLDGIEMLNICPVSISYQYDPCDYLKAREMQLRRDIPNWRKTKRDDLVSMETGIKGWKGDVVFRMTPSINHWLHEHRAELEKLTRQEQVQAVAAQIDKQIHANYEIYPRGEEFENYLQERIDKIDIADKDETFLHDKLEEMYHNPVLNYEEAQKQQ